jgi:tRNA-specific 2-thiouridylase
MKTAVLLSGGVDSSVALYELLRQGRTDVTAYYLKIWLEDELSYLGDCPWEEDLGFARAVCDAAGVPLKVVPLQAEYYEKVVEYALAELRVGHTPSPDIFCNQRVKFGAFYDKVGDHVDRVASGHYGVVDRSGPGPVRLLRSPDPVKDQTYFLSHLSQAQVAKIEFPIGGYRKNRVRELAHEYNLANQARKDSQGICFLGKIKYNDFVKYYLGEKPGAIVDRETGKKLGEHKGFWFHTIGQRSGLGLGNGPWFVVGKDIDTNTVLVSHLEHRSNQSRSDFVAGELTWIHRAPEPGEALTCKLRHGPELLGCRVEASPDGSRLAVKLDDGDLGIAPGQFSVFYSGEECLGAGMILSVLNPAV